MPDRLSLHNYMQDQEVAPAIPNDMDQPDVPPSKPLTERFIPRTRDTSDRHIERLVEIEQSMLGTMNVLIERVARYTTQFYNTEEDMKEILTAHRTMLQRINESQVQITVMQAKLMEMLGILATKLARHG